jgi:hypothetical protein
MAIDPVRNFAITTVATVPSPAASGTTLVVASGAGALFPDPSSSGEFNVVIYPNGEQPSSTNAEIVRVTARTTDTLTIEREQESTSARTIVEGDVVMMAITKKFIDDVDTILSSIYPVGSVYINATSSTNPATLLGFGTWSAFGAGRVMVGLDSTDTDFDTAEETGGAKTVTLTSAQSGTTAHSHTTGNQSASHTHTGPSHNHSITHTHTISHTHTIGSRSGTGGWTVAAQAGGASTDTITTSDSSNANTGGSSAANTGSGGTGNTGSQSASHNHTVNNSTAASASEAHSNVQPYITVYMWKRTE